MIVARSFSPPSNSFLGEKNDNNSVSIRSLRDRSKSPLRTAASSPVRNKSSSSLALRSQPVQIPLRASKSTLLKDTIRSAPITVKENTTRQPEIQAYKQKKESARDILCATTIPIRRKGRPPQRLPKGDHVADFSKFLLDDIPAGKDFGLSRNQSLPQADGLFGNIDELLEGQIIVGSEPLDEGTLSARSISSDSLNSLASPDDYGSSQVETRSSVGRSPQGRHAPRISHSEDCSRDHPLAEFDESDSFSLTSQGSTPIRPSSPASRAVSPPPRTTKKEPPRSSFKSTLTSSLKALKSAARTTILSSSGFGHHSGAGSQSLYNNESMLAHNFFDIQPSLTDDRRPPPTMTKPSPELRRYLNPQMASAPPDSPTQLHFWQDERYAHNAKREAEMVKQKIKHKHKQRRKRSPGPKSRIDALPSIVPLSTCLPPTVRTANASSPPIWLSPDGEPLNKSTSSSLIFDPDASAVYNNGIPKTREPRENPDFLRMYVCETAMRRSGKLSDDISAGRAKLWLPPLGNGTQPTRKVGAARWTVTNIDEAVDSEAVSAASKNTQPRRSDIDHTA